MSGLHWIILFRIIAVVVKSNANKIIIEDETTKWLYHEKSKQEFSIRNSNPAALFGYSIAYQKTINSLIVGSPNESEIGKIYKCAIEDKSTKCDAFESPALSHPHNLWLGATVNAGESFVMACAPRTVKTTTTNDFTGVYGSCYYQNDLKRNSLNSMKSIRPNDDEARSTYHKTVYHGMNQPKTSEICSDTLGWSSYIGERYNIFVGGPAMSVGHTAIYPGVTQEPRFIEVDNQKLKHKRVNFNFGYSITSGHFEVEGKEMIAISSPYGTIGYGRVYFYEYDDPRSVYVMKDPEDMLVEGEQVGSLFGAALCAFNSGDGYSALLVGAPAYANDIKSYDTGAVYVYHFGMNEENEVPRKNPLRIFKGNSSGGYFGAAMVSIGDFDGDGKDEVAIGAPYEQNGRGAVYIYSGKQLLTTEEEEDEIRDKLYLQKILPKDGPDQYFGWALNAPADADNNGCKELAIGAPGGNYVTLLRCMASVNVSFSVKFPDLKDQIQTLSKKDASFSFEPCLSVTYPEKPNPKTLETEIMFEVKLVHQDVKILGVDSKGFKVFKAALSESRPSYCNSVTVQLPKDADYDEDITFNMIARLDQSQDPLQSSTFNPRLVLLNGKTSLNESFTAPPLRGSDLSFEIRLSNNIKDGYIIGSTVSETLSFSMRNAASTAHGVCVLAQVSGVRISALPPRICSYSAEKLNCTKDILKKGETWNVTVTLDTKHMTSASDKLEIFAELRTKKCSKPTGKNVTRINLISDSNINVTGYAKEVRMTKEELKSRGVNYFEHIYTITNFGSTTWANLQCEVSLPPGILHNSEVYVIHDDSTSKHCEINNSKHTASCKIEILKQNQVQIRVRMHIGPDDPMTARILDGRVASIDSHLTLPLKMVEIREKTLSSKITITEAASAPLWIYIVAGLVGLLTVIIICWALHECGFLRRNKKKQLEELKENVKRQSMRRSMMLRQSTMEVRNQQDPSERQRLVDLHGEEGGSKDLATRDPARAAFEAELARALSKDKNRVGALQNN